MASVYPGALDEFDEPANTLAGPPTHEDLHLQLSDGLAAVQAALGVDPAGDEDTVADRFGYLYALRPSAFGPGSAGSGTALAATASSHVNTLTIPAPARAGYALVWGKIQVIPVDEALADWSHWRYVLSVGGVEFAGSSHSFMGDQTSAEGYFTTMSTFGIVAIAEGVSTVIQAHLAPGEAIHDLNYVSDSTRNSVMALFVPTA